MALFAYREMRADFKERCMIHLGGTDGPGVLHMTAAAILDVGMEGGRLLAEIGRRSSRGT